MTSLWLAGSFCQTRSTFMFMFKFKNNLSKTALSQQLLFRLMLPITGIASPALDAGQWCTARPSPQSCCECRSSTAVRDSQPLCVQRTVMSMTHAFFYLFTSSGSCRIFDSGCANALRLLCQRLAGTALALLLRVKLTNPAPDGTFAKRHTLCGLHQGLFMIFRCSLGDS